MPRLRFQVAPHVLDGHELVAGLLLAEPRDLGAIDHVLALAVLVHAPTLPHRAEFDHHDRGAPAPTH